MFLQIPLTSPLEIIDPLDQTSANKLMPPPRFSSGFEFKRRFCFCKSPTPLTDPAVGLLMEACDPLGCGCDVLHSISRARDKRRMHSL